MDRHLLKRFVMERKRYSIYPPISVNTTNEEGAEAVADFMADFYEEFDQWKKQSAPTAIMRMRKYALTLMGNVTDVTGRPFYRRRS